MKDSDLECLKVCDVERKRGRHAVGQTGQLSRGSVCSLLAAYIDTHPSDQTSHQHWLGAGSVFIFTVRYSEGPGAGDENKARKDKNQSFSLTCLVSLTS